MNKNDSFGSITQQFNAKNPTGGILKTLISCKLVGGDNYQAEW